MKTKRSAFTLVELVVVVLILGIIATVAVPRVVRSATSASESALKQDLASIRSAIELYSNDHGGTFPGAVADGLSNAANSEACFKSQLLNYTNVSGGASTTKGVAYPLGPYLRKPFTKCPVGPNAGTETIKMETSGAVLTGADESTGWRYDVTTGEFIVNSNDLAQDGTTQFDQF
jgi:general secretion pathway protein G